MTRTHIIIRITTSPKMPLPQHAAYGPVDYDEACELMQAGLKIFQNLKMEVTLRDDGTCITAWRKGGATTWKLLLVELRPNTAGICEGVK